MKKSNKKNSNNMENSAIAITADFVESRLLRNLVEKLADRRYDIGYSHEKVEPGWLAIETSSIEAHVSGQMSLSSKDDEINMLFTTCFLFTCTKAKGQDYSLTWVNSLS
jgi:hypothetical protein